MSIVCKREEAIISRELAEVDPLAIVDPIDQQICELVAAVLLRHYPGHDWLVQADRRKGLIDIRNLSLDGALGVRIPMNGAATASELEKMTMRYGGEILERFHVARGALRQDEVAALPRDFAGRLRADQ
jgi:hypothetical protein